MCGTQAIGGGQAVVMRGFPATGAQSALDTTGYRATGRSAARIGAGSKDIGPPKEPHNQTGERSKKYAENLKRTSACGSRSVRVRRISGATSVCPRPGCRRSVARRSSVQSLRKCFNSSAKAGQSRRGHGRKQRGALFGDALARLMPEGVRRIADDLLRECALSYDARAKPLATSLTRSKTRSVPARWLGTGASTRFSASSVTPPCCQRPYMSTQNASACSMPQHKTIRKTAVNR